MDHAADDMEIEDDLAEYVDVDASSKNNIIYYCTRYQFSGH